MTPMRRERQWRLSQRAARAHSLHEQPYSINDFDFIEKIERNFINDFYSSSVFEFEPGFWTEEYAEIKSVHPIPEIMFNKVNGKVVENPTDFTEGCPPELDVLLQELYEKYH